MKAKSNKRNSVLLFIVIIVWGLIGYRLLDLSDNTPAYLVKHDEDLSEDLIAIPEADTFQLLLNYSDPFSYLYEKRMSNSFSIDDQTSVRNTLTTRNRLQSQMDLKYVGYYKNIVTGKVYVNVVKQGENLMLNMGENDDEIYLLEFGTDSIKLKIDTTVFTLKMYN